MVSEMSYFKIVWVRLSWDEMQSCTGKYRGLQGNHCNENRIPAMRTGFFPVRIDLQGLGL
jgi:hypothetical protein